MKVRPTVRLGSGDVGGHVPVPDLSKSGSHRLSKRRRICDDEYSQPAGKGRETHRADLGAAGVGGAGARVAVGDDGGARLGALANRGSLALLHRESGDGALGVSPQFTVGFSEELLTNGNKESKLVEEHFC